MNNSFDPRPPQIFEAEFLKILKRHGIEYDPRYVFG
jgi:hypothetical protein